MTKSPIGWRSRGYLPHCDDRGLVQHIVFGLADAFGSVPSSIKGSDERAAWADKAFDAERGRRLLAKAANAEEMQRILLHDDGQLYALAAWCIMPTHVHVFVEILPDAALADIVQAWKSISARAINKLE